MIPLKLKKAIPWFTLERPLFNYYIIDIFEMNLQLMHKITTQNVSKI